MTPDTQSVIAPPMFSLWRYKKHPERVYRVVGIANIAHLSDRHPVTVVYSTADHPERLWTRPVADFLAAFAPTEATA